jgi:hypothetical protein
MPSYSKIIRNERDRLKKEFAQRNIELFERAYIEKLNKKHLRHKHKAAPTAYGEFIAAAREEFKYSKGTVDIDIWLKFQFSEITMGIEDRMKKRKLMEPAARKTLGYISVEKEPIVGMTSTH